MFNVLRGLIKSEHQRVGEMLSAYIDGELSASEVELVERHLKECAACARSLETLRATVELVRRLPQVPAPRSFTIAPAIQPLRFQMRWDYAHLRGATALVALLLAIALSIDIVSQRLPLAGAPAELAIAPSPAVEMKAALKEAATEGALEAVPPQGLGAEATLQAEASAEALRGERSAEPSAEAPQGEALTPQATALPAPKPTPEATPEAPPQEVSAAIPQPARPWLKRLRQIEFTLLLALTTLAAITIAVRTKALSEKYESMRK